MGDVVDLLPCNSEIRHALLLLHGLHHDLSAHQLLVTGPSGADVTDREAAAIARTIEYLETALSRIAGKRKK
jgi:hypothetical protein